jgi:hypothetical protein
MSVRKGQSHTPHTTAAPDYGVIDPDTFWDQVLPYPPQPQIHGDPNHILPTKGPYQP